MVVSQGSCTLNEMEVGSVRLYALNPLGSYNDGYEKVLSYDHFVNRPFPAHSLISKRMLSAKGDLPDFKKCVHLGDTAEELQFQYSVGL